MRFALIFALLFIAAPARAQEVPSPLLGAPFDAGKSAFVVGFGDDSVHRRVQLGYEPECAGGWFCASLALGLSITPSPLPPEQAGTSSDTLRPVERLFPQASAALGWVGRYGGLVELGPVSLGLSPVLRVAGDVAPPLDESVRSYRLRAEGGLMVDASAAGLGLSFGALYDRDLTHLADETIPPADTLRLAVAASYGIPEEVLVTVKEGEKRTLVPQKMTTLLRLSLTSDRPLRADGGGRDGLIAALSIAY
jgi:hypothetical protein